MGRVTSPDLAGRKPVLLVPLGSTEQHGPHLPLDTDTRIAEAVAGAAAQRLTARGVDAQVAPPMPYGSSGEHAGFPGTLSIGQAALELLVVELVRSADRFGTVVLVSGHGGNAAPVQRAVATVTAEGRRALAWSPHVARGDAHAGDTETSLMLYLDPLSVRLDRAEPGNRAPLRDLLSRLQADGVAAVSPNGVLGDPTTATGETGKRRFDDLVADLVAQVSTFQAGHRG